MILAYSPLQMRAKWKINLPRFCFWQALETRKWLEIWNAASSLHFAVFFWTKLKLEIFSPSSLQRRCHYWLSGKQGQTQHASCGWGSTRKILVARVCIDVRVSSIALQMQYYCNPTTLNQARKRATPTMTYKPTWIFYMAFLKRIFCLWVVSKAMAESDGGVNAVSNSAWPVAIRDRFRASRSSKHGQKSILRVLPGWLQGRVLTPGRLQLTYESVVVDPGPAATQAPAPV